MQIDSKLQNVEVRVVAVVAAAFVAGVAFLLAEPFSADDYSVSDASAATSQNSPAGVAASHELQPALLEPALRSLDGVAHHG